MRNWMIILSLCLLIPLGELGARRPKRVHIDKGDRIEIELKTVDATTAVRAYDSRLRDNPEHRQVTIINPSLVYDLKVATYAFTASDTNYFAVYPSTYGELAKLELSNGASFYMLMSGGPAETIRVMRQMQK